jgi:hypothetical protein
MRHRAMAVGLFAAPFDVSACSRSILAAAKTIIAKCIIVGVVVAAFGIISCGAAEVATKDKILPGIDDILGLDRAGHCQQAWDVAWLLAENKDYAAPLALLRDSEWLRISSSTLHKAEIRTALGDLIVPISIYAALRSERDGDLAWQYGRDGIEMRKKAPKILRRLPPETKGRDVVISCFKSTEPSEVCVKLAVENHIIPAYDDYISAVKSLGKSIRIECQDPRWVYAERKFSRRFDRLTELFRVQKNCQQAWNEAWKLAEDKDYEALSFVAGLLPTAKFGLMHYPATAEENEAWMAFLMPLFVYSLLPIEIEEPPPGSFERRDGAKIAADIARRVVADWLDAPGPDANDRQPVADCLYSAASPAVCVKMAVDNHVIPDYDDYIASVKKITERFPVECLEPPPRPTLRPLPSPVQ